MSKKRQWRKGEKLRIVLIVATVILALLLIGIIAFTLIASRYLNMMNYATVNTTKSAEEISSIREDGSELISSGETVTTGKVELPPEILDPVIQGENVVNILLIGQDRRLGQGTQRSDSMILVTFNKTKGKVTLTSFMRDQYVHIPGHGNDKLCHAYAYGGMTLLNQTLYDHFGVEIDGNVEVDFSGFESIIDILGGVELDLTKKEARHLNKLEGWSLKEGINVLTGEQALLYSRIRSIDNDYSRTERQRKVLMSLIEEYKNQDLGTTMKMAEEFLPLVTTDIPQNQVMTYVMELFPMMSGAKVETLRIPVDGTFKGGYVRISGTNRKMWCQYDIDFGANREILQKIFDN